MFKDWPTTSSVQRGRLRVCLGFIVSFGSLRLWPSVAGRSSAHYSSDPPSPGILAAQEAALFVVPFTWWFVLWATLHLRSHLRTRALYGSRFSFTRLCTLYRALYITMPAALQTAERSFPPNGICMSVQFPGFLIYLKGNPLVPSIVTPSHRENPHIMWNIFFYSHVADLLVVAIIVGSRGDCKCSCTCPNVLETAKLNCIACRENWPECSLGLRRSPRRTH